jgi:hypothetical protein
VKYKNDEINYLLIFKILLKEKWIILFITLLFLFSSGLYNFTKKSTYNLDLSINLGNYSELEVDCDSYQATGSLIFCESKIPASLPVYSEEIIKSFNKKISTIKEKFPLASINTHFLNNEKLNITITSEIKTNLLEIKSLIFNELDYFDKLVFNIVKQSRENKAIFLNNQIEHIQKEQEYLRLMDFDANFQRDAQARVEVSNKLNKIDIQNQVEKYDYLFTLYHKLTDSNNKGRQTIVNSLVNSKNIKPLETHYNGILKSLSNDNYVHSKNDSEAKITDYKINFLKNIFASTLFGLFLSISLVIFRNSNILKD